MDNLLSQEDVKDALTLEANHFESSYLENLGNGKFRMITLPLTLQYAPINGMVVEDLDNDGNLDVLMVGNDYGNEVFVGRYDAFKGAVLLGQGNGKFKEAPASKTGFYVGGDAKGLVKLYGPSGKEIFAATQNIDSLKVFVKSETAKDNRGVFEPEQNDSWVEFVYGDGRKTKVELCYGSGYLSQSTRKVKIPVGVKEIIVYDFQGKARTVQPVKKT